MQFLNLSILLDKCILFTPKLNRKEVSILWQNAEREPAAEREEDNFGPFAKGSRRHVQRG